MEIISLLVLGSMAVDTAPVQRNDDQYIQPAYQISYDEPTTIQPVKQGDFAPLPSMAPTQPKTIVRTQISDEMREEEARQKLVWYSLNSDGPAQFSSPTTKPKRQPSGIQRPVAVKPMPTMEPEMIPAPVMNIARPPATKPTTTIVMNPVNIEIAEPIESVIEVTDSVEIVTPTVVSTPAVVVVESDIELNYEDFSSCDIKGNISSGKQQYYTPECGSYNRVKIDESKGEMMFCSIEEAEEAGFQMAMSCIE